jgi:hypothetical protein
MGWQVSGLPRNIVFPLDLYGFVKVSTNLIHIPGSKGEMQLKGMNDVGCAITRLIGARYVRKPVIFQVQKYIGSINYE